MKRFLFAPVLTLSAIGAAQTFEIDRSPTLFTEVPPVEEIGRTTNRRSVLERFQVEREMVFGEAFFYGVFESRRIGVSIYKGANFSNAVEVYSQSWDLIDLGELPGSEYGTRKYGIRNFGTSSSLLSPGRYYLSLDFFSSEDDNSFARVSAVDDDVLQVSGLDGRNRVTDRYGDLAMTFGTVPEPASMVVLGLGLLAERRFRRRSG